MTKKDILDWVGHALGERKQMHWNDGMEGPIKCKSDLTSLSLSLIEFHSILIDRKNLHVQVSITNLYQPKYAIRRSHTSITRLASLTHTYPLVGIHDLVKLFCNMGHISWSSLLKFFFNIFSCSCVKSILCSVHHKVELSTSYAMFVRLSID